MMFVYTSLSSAIAKQDWSHSVRKSWKMSFWCSRGPSGLHLQIFHLHIKCTICLLEYVNQNTTKKKSTFVDEPFFLQFSTLCVGGLIDSIRSSDPPNVIGYSDQKKEASSV